MRSTYTDAELANHYRTHIGYAASYRDELIKRGYAVTVAGKSLTFTTPANLKICKETVTTICL
jgi:hypothetical protein